MGRLTLWMADFNHIGLIGREQSDEWSMYMTSDSFHKYS